MKKVLIALDYGVSAQKIAEKGAELAKNMNAKVTLLHVVADESYYSSIDSAPFMGFYGYDFLSLYGNSFVKSTAVVDYRFYKKNHLNFTANYANIGNKLFDSEAWLERPNFSGYAFGYGLETIFGPLEVKHSWSPETRDHYTWFSIGYWF